MQSSSVRKAATYAVAVVSLIALAYSLWLSGLVVSILASGASREASEVGNGIFLLVYAALPVTIALASIGYVVSPQRTRRVGIVLTGASSLLAAIQVIWIIDLASRGVGPAIFAVGMTAVVMSVALVDFRLTSRLSG